MINCKSLVTILTLSITFLTALTAYPVSYGLPEKQPRWSYQTVGTVNVVEVSPNGARVLIGTSDGYAYLFDSNSDVPLDAASMGGAVIVIGFSYYGKYVGVASGNTLKVYNTTGNHLLFMWSFVSDPLDDYSQSGIHSLAFSSDGSLLVVGTWGYDDARTYVHLFNVTSGIKLWSYRVKETTSYKYDYVTVDMSSDGRYIVASSTYTQKAYFFDSGSSTPVYSYDTGAAANSVAMSFNGSHFVCGSNRVYYFGKDLIVPLWSHDIGGTVDSVSISGDASYIAATSETLLYLLKNDKTELWRYEVNSSTSQALVSTDGNYLSVRSGNFAYIFSRTLDAEPTTSAHDPIWIYDTKNTISSISTSADGRYTVVGSGGKILDFDVLRPPPPISPVTLNNPTNPKADSLDLSWTQNTEESFARYEIYVATLPEELGTVTQAITNQSSTTHTVIGLDASKTYYFVVRVVDVRGKFSDSNQVSGMTLPSAVTLYEPTEKTNSSLLLSWTRNTDSNFERYEIYMSNNAENLGSLVESFTDQSITTYNVTGLSPSTTYYFIVRVVNSQGLYSDSTQVSGTTLGGPSFPFDWSPLSILGIVVIIIVTLTLYLGYKRSRSAYSSPRHTPKPKPKRAKKRKDETKIRFKPTPATAAPSVRLPSGEIRCGNCGFVNNSNAKYCRNCREKL